MLDFPITHIGNASVLCQSECECLHKTVNMEVFFLRMMKISYLKGKALKQMYRVVSQTKEGIVSQYSIPYRGVNEMGF